MTTLGGFSHRDLEPAIAQPAPAVESYLDEVEAPAAEPEHTGGASDPSHAAAAFAHYADGPAAVPSAKGGAHPAVGSPAADPTTPMLAPMIGERQLADASQSVTLLDEIDNGITGEDYHDPADPDRPNAKAHSVRSTNGLGRLITAARRLQRAATAPHAPARAVTAFVDAVQHIETVYLATPMESTDAAVTARSPDAVPIAQVNSMIATWRAAGRLPVKFAVAADGSMWAGPADVAHNAIAGGNALSAGVLEVDAHDHMAGIENTSGGFRPGALRNNTALAALDSAGMLPDAAHRSQFHVGMNPTGSYANSHVAHRGTGTEAATVPIEEQPARRP